MTYQQGAQTFSDDTERFPPTSRLFDTVTVLWLLFPIIGTFFAPESYFSRSGTELPYPVTPIVLLFGSVLAMVMYARLMVYRKIRHEFAAYAIFVMALCSLAWSPGPAESFNRALRLLPSIAYGVLYAQYYPMRKFLRLLTIAFLLSALCSIFMGAFVPSLGNGNMGNGYENAWRGALMHKNAAGVAYALGVMTSLFALGTKSISYKLFIPAFLICAFALVMTQAGTPLMGLLMASAVAFAIFLVRRMPRGVSLILGVTVIMLAVMAALAVSAVPDVVVGLIGRDMTFTGRTFIWEAVWQLILDNPIRGYGYNFWAHDTVQRTSVYRAIGYMNPHSHQAWLDIWLQLGIVGLISAVLLMVRSVWFTARLALTSNRPIAPFLVIMPLFIFIESLTEVMFSEPAIMGIFWLTWAGIAGRLELERGRQR